MAGPGGIEVGRAALRVLPDLSQFTRSLERFIQRIERQVVVELPTTADTSGARRDIERVRQTEQRDPLKVPVKAQTDEFARRVRADVQKAVRAIEADIPITADGEKLRRELQAEVVGIERLLQIDVPVDPENAALFRRQVLDQVAEVQARVRANPVEVPVKYDRNAVRELARDVDRVGRSGLGGPGGGLSGRVALFTAIGAAAAFSLPSVLGLVGGLAQVAGAAALIPAAVAPAVAGVGALALGFSHLGDALGPTKTKADVEKVNEAMRSLAPSAREAVKSIRKLGPAFSRLRLDVQQQLFESLGGIITKVGKAYLPILQDGLRQVAATFNGIAQLTAKKWLDPAAMRDVKGILDDVAQAFRNVAPAVVAVGGAFLDITAVGADFLQPLALKVSDLAQRFADLVSTARDTGALHDFIAGGLQAIGDVAKILGAAGSALFGIIRAAQAAGSGTLGSFADVMQRVADVVNSPTFQRGLTQFFSGLQTGAKALGDALPAIGAALAAIAPGLADLAAAIGTGLGQLLQQVAQAIIAIAPTFNAIADSLANVNPQFLGLALGVAAAVGAAIQLAPAFEAIGGVLAAMVSPVGLVIAAIAGVVAGFIVLYQHSQPVRDAVAAVIGQFQALWAVAQPIIAQLAATVMQYWPQIQATARSVFTAVEAIVVAALTYVRAQIAVVTAAISWIWRNFGDTILNVIRIAFPAMLTIIRSILGIIAGVARAFTAALTGDWSGLSAALKNIWNNLWTGLKTTVLATSGVIVALVRGIGPKLLDAVSNFGTLLEHAGEALMEGLGRGIAKMASLPINAVAKVAAAIKGHFPGSPVKTGPLTSWNNGGAGKRLIEQGLVAGIDASRASARAAIGNVAGDIADARFGTGVGAGRGGRTIQFGDVYAFTPESLVAQLNENEQRLESLHPATFG